MEQRNTFGSNLVAYLAVNSIFFILIGSNLALVIGMCLFPFQVGVYVLLPYIVYTTLFFGNIQTKPSINGRWKWFSDKFFLFPILRTHLRMNFAPLPKSLSDAETMEGAQFVFALFQHGTAADFRIAMDGMLDQVFPNIYNKIRTLAASVLFAIPFIREIGIWTSLIDARRSVAEMSLDESCSLLVFPGGEAEQIRTVYQKERVFLKRRKGFLKLAMKKGVPVVPVYIFGVSDYYYTSNAFYHARLWLVNNLGICLPLSAGLWGSPFCPLPIKTTIVFGAPMSFPLKDTKAISNDELDAAHDAFCKALVGLFDSNKRKLGYADRELEIL